MTTYAIKSLKEYAKEHKLSQRKIAAALGIHYNTVYSWFTLDSNPSELAKTRIKQFLIKNL